MRFSQVLLWASATAPLVSAGVLEGAVVTPAPIPPNHEFLRRYRTGREVLQNLKQRQEENLDFCYGGFNQVTICDSWLKLNDECSSFETNEDYASYWKCMCGNGAVAAQQQCDWCLAAFSIYYITDIDEMATSDCSSYGASIAPVPASYLALASSFNATFTGTSTQGNTGTGRGPSRTSSTSAKKTSSASSRSTSVHTMFGGGGAAPTLTAPTTEVQSSPTPTGGVKTGAAQGWRSGDALLSSVVVATLGLAALCLI